MIAFQHNRTQLVYLLPSNMLSFSHSLGNELNNSRMYSVYTLFHETLIIVCVFSFQMEHVSEAKYDVPVRHSCNRPPQLPVANIAYKR